MTLREYIIYWQDAHDRQKSRPTTYAAHGYIFKNHILPKLGDVSLSELTEQRIGEFLEERRKFGGHRPEKPEYPGLSDETMRHIQTLLQQVLGQAVQDGLLAGEYCKIISPQQTQNRQSEYTDIIGNRGLSGCC